MQGSRDWRGLEPKQVKACARLLMIGAAKETNMDQQRPEPVDGLALLPSLFKAAGIVKGARRLIEKAQHRKVDLAVAIIAGRIDQARHMILFNEDVAAPEVTMKKSRPWSFRKDVSKAVRKSGNAAGKVGFDMYKMA
jgi:hypothetical protein